MSTATRFLPGDPRIEARATRPEDLGEDIRYRPNEQAASAVVDGDVLGRDDLGADPKAARESARAARSAAKAARAKERADKAARHEQVAHEDFVARQHERLDLAASGRVLFTPGSSWRKIERDARAFRKLVRTSPELENLSAQARLRQEISMATASYYEAVTRTDLHSKRVDFELHGMHKAYVALMALTIVDNFDEGLSAESIISAATMGATMWALSPGFRGEGIKKMTQLRDGVVDRIATHQASDKKAERDLGDRQEKWLRRAERWVPGGKALSVTDRPHYTAYTAGLVEAGLAEAAYHAMREPGADIDELTESYSRAVEQLYTFAKEDGIEPVDVARMSRMVAGYKIAEQGPAAMAVYSELVNGQYRRSDEFDFNNVDNAPKGPWNGSFSNRDGAAVDRGSFGLRPPMDVAEHHELVYDMMMHDMLTCRDPQDLSATMLTYITASGYLDGSDGLVGENVPEAFRLRMRQTASVIQAMDDDGIAVDQRQKIYVSAFANAIDELSARRPELASLWQMEYGSNWQEEFMHAMQDPTDAVKAWEKMRAEHRGQRTRDERGNDFDAEQAARDTRRDPSEPTPSHQSEAHPTSGPTAEDSAARRAREASMHRNSKINAHEVREDDEPTHGPVSRDDFDLEP